jgi:hypothetical protein
MNSDNGFLKSMVSLELVGFDRGWSCGKFERTLLAAEQECGVDFLRLANALSALYPRGSEEKRLLDAMLLAVPC